MYLLAPFIFGIVFMLIFMFPSCIFKAIFKIQNFSGFCAGLCCAIVTGIVIAIFVIIMSFLFAFLIINIPHDKEKEFIEDLTIGSLLFILAFYFILLVIIFLFIYIFTKKVSEKEISYNSIFMFASGYILFKAIFLYSIWILIVYYLNYLIEKAIPQYGDEESAAAEILGIFDSFFLH